MTPSDSGTPRTDFPVLRLRFVNGWSNHRGLAAWNLWLNNLLSMWRYYRRVGWPESTITTPQHYRKEAFKALILGWTPWQIRVRRVSP